MHTGPHDKASETSAEQGEVIVDGPAEVAFSMTPEAARETGERLKASADEASDAPDKR